MIDSLQEMSRALSPSDHLVLKCLCSGQSNAAISKNTHFSLKSVENTISRSAKVFGVVLTPDINFRVLLALAYRANFQNMKFDSTAMAIAHLNELKLSHELA